ncbi:hypothetical protein H257_01809 [Aphanomyces astaci]|uniref:Uncharacterized protein n=1 Tax=Aphanomyces astaci TaxID=112090 RepID=W4H3W4_APHAT|nr:hypothetical protein H257_01809 [Aphanomyces astaci]ETV86690.1 hypothetical protein H257_01809 [Aphanomyces astaci]|eukprot:XP_009823489.1 hypothetical protein H257_01809 [Aphanomyces astaci]
MSSNETSTPMSLITSTRDRITSTAAPRSNSVSTRTSSRISRSMAGNDISNNARFSSFQNKYSAATSYPMLDNSHSKAVPACNACTDNGLVFDIMFMHSLGITMCGRVAKKVVVEVGVGVFFAANDASGCGDDSSVH